MSPSLDVDALRRLYAKSANAKAVLDHFADRQKNASETTVDTISATLNRGGVDVPRAEIVGILRDLARAGAGQFVVGRKGHLSRFVWTGSSTEIGTSAQGGASRRNSEPGPLTASSLPQRVKGFVEHPFLLRPGVGVSLGLPSDLTLTEARRIADFVLSLPFER